MAKILSGQLANSNFTKTKDLQIHLPGVPIAVKLRKTPVLAVAEAADPDRIFLLPVLSVAKLTLCLSSPKGRMYCAVTALKPTRADKIDLRS